jgi:hypothetical protein
MANDSLILIKIDDAILAVMSAIASGDNITEYVDGPIRVKSESPALLLETLQKMKSDYLASTGERSAATLIHQGVP